MEDEPHLVKGANTTLGELLTPQIIHRVPSEAPRVCATCVVKKLRNTNGEGGSLAALREDAAVKIDWLYVGAVNITMLYYDLCVRVNQNDRKAEI